jgi:hypothetical protein
MYYGQRREYYQEHNMYRNVNIKLYTLIQSVCAISKSIMTKTRIAHYND